MLTGRVLDVLELKLVGYMENTQVNKHMKMILQILTGCYLHSSDKVRVTGEEGHGGRESTSW